MRKTCTDLVYELAKHDSRIVFIGSDLGAGLLDQMKAEFPDRFFMEGVCEQNLIGMAAGLAMEGFIPYLNTIATFITRRCYEQIAIDLCLHNLPVRLIGNGGGMVYAPLGPTHMATDDIAILRALPNMAVIAPTDAEEMRRLMPKTVDWPGPMYIRLGKGGDAIVSKESDDFLIGKANSLRLGDDALIITTGIMASRALKAADILAYEGIQCGVLNMPTIKPIDKDCILNLAKNLRLIITVEEHTKIGGLGSAVSEVLIDELGSNIPTLKRLGLPDIFPKHYGSQDVLLEEFGLDAQGIAESIKHTYTDSIKKKIG